MTAQVLVVPALNTGGKLQPLLKDRVSKQGLGLKNHSTGTLQLTLRIVRAVEKSQVRDQYSTGDRELLLGWPDYLYGPKAHTTAHGPIKMSSFIYTQEKKKRAHFSTKESDLLC